MAEIANVGHVVGGVKRTVWTDVAEVALRMNALLYFDCLGQIYSIQWVLGALCCNSDGTVDRIIPL